MSRRHPIIAVTGSSGAGRGTVKQVLDRIFQRTGLTAAYVDGASFHRYDRAAMKKASAEAFAAGNYAFSHFGPDANLFDEQEALYRTWGETGTGRRRFYLHTAEDAERLGYPELKAGGFTPWEELPPDTDLLLYEGLHGVVRTVGGNLAGMVDLKVGVVPVINLEWTRKVHNDTLVRGYSPEAVVDTILNRMDEYVRYIIPQFKHSDVNFQQVPVVDTSHPFIARDVPSVDESVTVIRFSKPEAFRVDFPNLLDRLEGSWMSRRNTIVVPGGKTELAMELVFTPIVGRLKEGRNAA